MGQWLGHNGAVLGFTDQLGCLPDKQATVAVAVNQYGAGTSQLLPVDAALLWFDLVDALYPGTGLVPAAGVTSFGSHASPFEIPLVPEDGAWQIVPSWICQFFTAAERPAACDASPAR